MIVVYSNELFYEQPVRIQTAIFERLMSSGRFRQGDARQAAMAFYGPVFSWIHVCDEFGQMEPLLLDHLRAFLAQYAWPEGERKGSLTGGKE